MKGILKIKKWKKLSYSLQFGDFECLKAAVQNGADSVYFGAANFNARASATNFDLSNLKEAISYAKLRGVNTHLTLNTLIKDNEFEEAVLLAQKAYEFGIDAIIVQDLGLARYLINNFPDLPIHASTQMTIHNLEGVLEAEKLGFRRVVLSRELSLEEIQYICSHTKVEIETFIHGALCICYSGQCLFSSMVGGRSGNRGKCAQPCRLPYELVSKSEAMGTFLFASSVPNASHKSKKSEPSPFFNSSSHLSKSLENEKLELPSFPTKVTKGTDVTFGNVPNGKGYLLSTRDLCGLDFLPKLIEAGVMCFKIEGRMKSPEYVATTTRIYRKYIDLALSGEPYAVDKKDIEDLMQVFNRGNFSTGHFSNEPNKDLVYSQKPNNMGIYIGNVSNIKAKKGHVLVNLTHAVSLGDSISFEKENTKYTISELMLKGKNIENAKKDQFVEIGRMKGNINIGDKVYRIASKELSDFAKNSYKSENKKIPVIANITLKKNEPVVLDIATSEDCSNPLFKDIKISVTSTEIASIAKSSAISEERIIGQLSKTGDTIFSFNKINVELEDNLFLPIKTLNELRRSALEELIITAQSKIIRSSPKLNDIKHSKINKKKKGKNISVLLNILNENEAYENLNGINQVYIPLKYFANKKYEKAINAISNGFEVYIYLPPIIKANYKNILTNVVNKSIDKFSIKGFVISNLSSSIFAQKIKEKYGERFKFIGNYTLNVYNQFSANELQNLGIEKLTVSPELDSTTMRKPYK